MLLETVYGYLRGSQLPRKLQSFLGAVCIRQACADVVVEPGMQGRVSLLHCQAGVSPGSSTIKTCRNRVAYFKAWKGGSLKLHHRRAQPHVRKPSRLFIVMQVHACCSIT